LTGGGVQKDEVEVGDRRQRVADDILPIKAASGFSIKPGERGAGYDERKGSRRTPGVLEQLPFRSECREQGRRRY